MRFKETLHPEVLLNRRGTEMERHLAQMFLASFQKENGKWLFTPSHPIINTLGTSDANAFRFWTLCKEFILSKGSAYHVTKDLLLALSEIDREIPVTVLPERWVGYINFAPRTLRDDDGWVVGGYVYVGPAKESPLLQADIDPNSDIIWMSYINEGAMAGAAPVYALIAELKDRSNMFDLAMHVPHYDFDYRGNKSNNPTEEQNRTRLKVCSALINAACYIHAPESVIETVSPHPAGVKIKKKHLRPDRVMNECTIPVTFLNWRYKRRVVYSKGETWVDTFPRWQPCGPGRILRKWIMVEGHPRHYKQGTPSPP